MSVDLWTPELLATIPDDVLLSEAQRRRNAKRKTRSGGKVWSQHNADVNNCRCAACIRRRAWRQK